MKLNILAQEYYEDLVSMKLVNHLKHIFSDDDNTTLYYRFPLIKELDKELRYPNVLIISKSYGVILFKCSPIEKNRNDESIEFLSDETMWLEDYIFSKLFKSENKKMKRDRRNLAFELNSALFVPNYSEEINTECTSLQTEKQITDFLKNIPQNEIDNDIISEIFSSIEGSTAIVKAKNRPLEEGDTYSKAYMLKQLEQEIAVFDENQKYAALSQLIGPQRIRGLAGTGKTIILAMKAALIHLNNPNAKILYTFMTKSLYDYIEILITRFYKSLGDGNLPDFENAIHIRHAWGGINVKGVYYDCCIRENITPIEFGDALSADKDPFNYICKNLMDKKKGIFEKYYDYVLIDEAQDFMPSFYQLCRAIVKNDSLAWGYDDLQNIFHVKIQDTIQTFENKYGYNGIDLPTLQKQFPDMENDIVLSKSYRNPREILILSHAIGFGIYNDQLIQSLENNEHWHDLGYIVEQGNCKDNDYMVISRPIENSPLSISNYQKSTELIKLFSANDFSEELKWITEQIVYSINEDKLRPDDVMVISLDDRNAKLYFKNLEMLLHSYNIQTYNLSSISYQKGFYKDGCVTLSTLYKAKGNEAPMVFVVGSDVFNSAKDDIAMRNKIFTAFTRTKAWLRISGIDMSESPLFKEIKEIERNNYVLKFQYKRASVIKRDLNDINKRKTKQREEAQKMIKSLKQKGISQKEIEQMVLAEFGDDENESGKI